MSVGLILLGPPGSGKGTQAKRIEKVFHLPHISTGDILREAIDKGTPLGKEAEEYMKRGDLVPDHVVNGIVKERLSKPDCKRGFILDGYPRTVPQAISLEEILKNLSLSLYAVIHLNVSDEEVVRRLTNRRICPKCGAIYNLLIKPPNDDEVCDVCRSKLIRRKDDEEDVIRRRLEVYRRETEPLIKYYEERGLLKNIEADGTVDEIWREISAIVSEALLRDHNSSS